MEKYASALAAFGGLAAIGGFIDLVLYRDRKRVEAWMIDWWVRFSDVKWANFGAAEARYATARLDRWAGARLFSMRRLRLTLGLSLASLGLAVAITLLRPDIRAAHAGSSRGWGLDEPLLVGLLVMFVLATTIALALSFSVMRLIADLVRRADPRGWAGFLFFLALLALHVVLLLYWSAVVTAILYLAIGLPFAAIDSFFTLGGMIESAVERLARIGADPLGALLDPFDTAASAHLSSHVISLHKVLADFLSNGLRIGFALVFLSAWLFGSLLQPLASRLWEGLIDSRKPFFTTILGGLGAIYAGLRVLFA